MNEKEFKHNRILNPEYRRMLKPTCLKDQIDYLEYLTKFYFSVIIDLGLYKFKDEFQAEMSTFIQMMFSKAKMFRNLLDGFSHSNGIYHLSNLIDHTILFTIVRTAYEQLCAFELVYVLPNTDDKRLILKNAYIASGLSNRQKMFTKEELIKNKAILNEEINIINDCRFQIHNTNLYKSLNNESQIVLNREIFNNGNFQLYFNDTNKLIPHVGWDQVRNLCSLGTDTLKGLYKYACNMAHPSYLGLTQYRVAFKKDVTNNLVETATMQLSSIMSVFIMDYINKYPMVKHVFDNLDFESQYMICMYNHTLRSDSN